MRNEQLKGTATKNQLFHLNRAGFLRTSQTPGEALLSNDVKQLVGEIIATMPIGEDDTARTHVTHVPRT